jgi:uncharacterized membrane protein
MAIAMMSWLLAIPLLGIGTGLRTFTPMAVLCWFAYNGALSVDGTWAAWTGRLWVAILFTVLAAGELAADKLPGVPARISKFPLLARLIFGGLVGSIAATAMEGPGIEGVLLGVLCALLGAFGGYMVRRDLVEKFQCMDWMIAVSEDIFTIGIALYAARIVSE